ncbi:MAG: Flp family type IVb pilin [Burkholderiales bacterium]
MSKGLQWLKERLSALHGGERAQDLIEYALIAAMVSFMVVAVSGSVAYQISTGATNVGKKFKTHVDRGLHKGWYK